MIQFSDPLLRDPFSLMIGIFGLLLTWVLAIALQKEDPRLRVGEKLCRTGGLSIVLLNCSFLLIMLAAIALSVMQVKSPLWFLFELLYLVGLATSAWITPWISVFVLMAALIGRLRHSYRPAAVILAVLAVASSCVDLFLYFAAPKIVP